jgi:ribosomal protein L9
MKVGERGKTFGSVGSTKIQEALKRKKIVVEKEWILLDDPIKEAGDRIVKIRLPRSIECELKVTIKSES